MTSTRRAPVQRALLILLAGALATGCVAQSDEGARAKFEPADGEVLLFTGQELDAIGGLEAYNDGYLDHFETPAGFTMYSNLTPGSESFGFVSKGLDGIYSTDDWGDGDSNMSLQLADPDFEYMALAIGLSLVDQEEFVADGSRDDLIERMGEFFLSLGDRPVFLRIGYEFDGHSWNRYEIEPYKAAFRRIRDRLEAMSVDNVAYVWQSSGFVTPLDLLEEWYPGDEYVDWCGYSHFARWEEQQMIAFAREKGKPVFVAEATPALGSHTFKFDGVTRPTLLSDPEQAEEAWEKWFLPLFETIDDNPDVVKAVSYINANWRSRPMWVNNPSFRGLDARLHINPSIAERWREEVGNSKYLKARPDLFEYLGSQ